MNTDYVLSAMIMFILLVAIWVSRRDAEKHGKANPVDTGTLQADVASLKNRMGRMETDIKNIRKDMDEAPTKADIATVVERVAGVQGHVESIDQAVVRIENILMNGAVAAATAATGSVRRRK